ncbi:hypothetical protein V3I01_08135 [Sphingomonas sp. gentR]|uniref:hypothetical protein n=1 Tax=Sphingomonas sp. gentR TaxID=3118768 RepID=UPI0030D50C95
MKEYPHIRRVGAYAFFAFLAFSGAMIAGVLARRVGVSDLVERLTVFATFAVCFTALRDMTTRPLPTSEEAGA